MCAPNDFQVTACYMTCPCLGWDEEPSLIEPTGRTLPGPAHAVNSTELLTVCEKEEKTNLGCGCLIVVWILWADRWAGQPISTTLQNLFGVPVPVRPLRSHPGFCILVFGSQWRWLWRKRSRSRNHKITFCARAFDCFTTCFVLRTLRGFLFANEPEPVFGSSALISEYWVPPSRGQLPGVLLFPCSAESFSGICRLSSIVSAAFTSNYLTRHLQFTVLRSHTEHRPSRQSMNVFFTDLGRISGISGLLNRRELSVLFRDYNWE